MSIFTPQAMKRWRADPVLFIEEVLINPEDGKPFKLLDSEREFLKHAFKLKPNGRLLYPEMIYACPKKSGKTTWAAVFMITLLLLYGGQRPEGISAANDEEQATSRVLEQIKRIVEASPALAAEARIISGKVIIADAIIISIPSSASSAAGSNQNIAVLDEAWAYTSENARRLVDELIPPPTRKIACRLTVTYAGWTGESKWLEEMYLRSLTLPEIGPSLRAGDGMLCFWSHEPVAYWQDADWLADMRKSLRPSQYARMIENRFSAAHDSFISLSEWDQCVDSSLKHVISDRKLQVWAGCDASTKHDSTALALVTFDQQDQCVRLVDHRIFVPTPEHPIDFELAIEQTILDWNGRFNLKTVYFDPFQMASTNARLVRAGVPMEEYSQSTPNLTATAENLFELVRARNLQVYPSEAIRLAVSQTVASESSRGWKLSKLVQSHKIDIVIALSMAALAAVRAQAEPQGYDPKSAEFARAWLDGPDPDDPAEIARRKAEADRRAYRDELMNRFGRPVSLNFDRVKRKDEVE